MNHAAKERILAMYKGAKEIPAEMFACDSCHDTHSVSALIVSVNERRQVQIRTEERTCGKCREQTPRTAKRVQEDLEKIHVRRAL